MLENLIGTPIFNKEANTLAHFEHILSVECTNTSEGSPDLSLIQKTYTPEDDSEFIIVISSGGNFYASKYYIEKELDGGKVEGNYNKYFDFQKSKYEDRLSTTSNKSTVGYYTQRIIFGKFIPNETLILTAPYSNTGSHGLIGAIQLFKYNKNYEASLE